MRTLPVIAGHLVRVLPGAPVASDAGRVERLRAALVAERARTESTAAEVARITHHARGLLAQLLPFIQ